MYTITTTFCQELSGVGIGNRHTSRERRKELTPGPGGAQPAVLLRQDGAISGGVSEVRRIRSCLVSKWEYLDPRPSTRQESPDRRSGLWIGRRRVRKHGRCRGGQERR